MTTGKYEFIRSYSRPGESQVIFMARDSLRSRRVPELWYQVRKKVGDIPPTLPQGIGPFFNDEFGDTFGNIYALTGDGFDYAELKDYAERIRRAAARAGRRQGRPDRLQDEKIFIELRTPSWPRSACRSQQVRQALASRTRCPAGFFETGSDRVNVRVDRRVRLGRGDPRLPRSAPATARSGWATSRP